MFKVFICLFPLLVFCQSLLGNIKIGLFGDSNSCLWESHYENAWAYRLASDMKEQNVQFVNFAKCSYDSRMIDSIHQKALEKDFFDIVIINAGLVDFINDQSVEQAKNFIIKMIERSLKAGSIVILGQIHIDYWYLDYYSPCYLEEINRLYQTLSLSYPVIFYPFIDSSLLNSYHNGDYIHPNRAGHQMIYQRIKPKVLEALDCSRNRTPSSKKLESKTTLQTRTNSR